MSYLSPVRLHFAGRFQANVSTVNNDPGHFDNAAFLAAYQEMQTADAANRARTPPSPSGPTTPSSSRPTSSVVSCHQFLFRMTH